MWFILSVIAGANLKVTGICVPSEGLQKDELTLCVLCGSTVWGVNTDARM